MTTVRRLTSPLLAQQGYCTAFAGTMLFNWTDVCKVRMQAESMTQPDASLRRYVSFSGTFRTILAEEGFRGLMTAGSA